MTTQKRPQRRRKSDRLLSPGATVNEQQCDMALAPFDRAATASETKWGIDRLPSLVSPETARIWGRTMANLNAAIDKADPGDVVACVQSALRGLEIMDAEATAAGHEPAKGMLFEFEIEPDGDGQEPFRFAVLEEDMEWRTVKDKRPDLVIFSKREIAQAMRFYLRSDLFLEVKKQFPGAQVTKIKPSVPVDYANGGDEVPF